MNLTITGMDVLFAGCENLDLFDYAIYAGDQISGELKPEWKNETRMLLKVINGAVANARQDSAEGEMHRLAIIIIHPGDTRIDEMQIKDAVAGFGSVLNFSKERAPWITALEKASGLLAQPDWDGVVIAAADIQIKPVHNVTGGGKVTMGFDIGYQDWDSRGGAAAVLLKNPEMIRNNGSAGYAVIRSFKSSHSREMKAGSTPQPSAVVETIVTQCCQQALQEAGMHAKEIEYIDTFASGEDSIDHAEIAGLIHAYQEGEGESLCGIGSVAVNIGDILAVAGIASLIRTALLLSHRFIPATRDWSRPKFPELWGRSPFYIPQDSRTWFTMRDGANRSAASNYFDADGSFIHIILDEYIPPLKTRSDVDFMSSRIESGNGAGLKKRFHLTRMGFYLFPIVGEDITEITRKAITLKNILANGNDLAPVSDKYLEEFQTRPEAAFALSLLGHNRQELEREINFTLKGIASSVERKTDWQTPLGSYFTPQPLGNTGQVAFVYPGAFNSYAGFGRDLLYLFPELYQRISNLVGDVGSAIQEKSLYPRSINAFSKEDLNVIETQLIKDPIAMLTSGMTVAILYTLIMNEVFQVENHSSFGYSLGENSMMFASGVMTHGEEGKKKLEESPLFHTRLAGPKNAVREYWGMAPADDTSSDDSLWVNYVLMANPQSVRELIDDEERVFLTHINTPKQVAIAGESQSCERIIESLHCNALKAPFDYVLHCAAMQSEYPALVTLHSWPVNQTTSVKLYSSADCDLFPIEREAIARKMAKGLCSMVDFPRLISRVYNDGARLFVELGAGSNCTRWIDETLKKQPHCAMSINRRGVDDFSSILKVLARLCSQRVPLDLSVLRNAS